MLNGENNEWFQSWFDSPYYHALYEHRNQEEAAEFLTNLLHFINLKKDAKILDLACGKGRHSLFLNQQGFDVTGVDLSCESIKYANQFANSKLHFEVQDMRYFTFHSPFDCVFNLFTSFGYFDNEEDNNCVLKSVCKHLAPDGLFVLDYFNMHKVSIDQQAEVEKQAHGYHFKISKRIDGGRVFKDIQVIEGDKTMHFTEQVQLLDAPALYSMMAHCGLHPIATFGNYKLQPFEADKSDRLIIISRKV
jgi:SAM-dependent methyltransferase